FTHPEGRDYRVPLNVKIGKIEIPVGVGLITLVLLLIALVNLVTKPKATVAGVVFSFVLFCAFVVSEKFSRKSETHTEMDQFNVAARSELTPETVGCRPGNVLVPVSNYHALYHLSAVLDRVKTERRDIVVLNVRVLKRAVSGEFELDANQMF